MEPIASAATASGLTLAVVSVELLYLSSMCSAADGGVVAKNSAPDETVLAVGSVGAVADDAAGIAFCRTISSINAEVSRFTTGSDGRRPLRIA